MTLEQTLRRMLLNYPSLFSGAIEAYNHLFLVVGNGYTWENGELINTCRAENETDDVREAINNVLDFIWFKGDSEKMKDLLNRKPHIKEVLQRSRAKMCGEAVERILTTELRMKDLSVPEKYENLDTPFKFYPLSTLSKIYNLPSDIKPDYLEAAETIYNALLENPDKVRDDEGILGEIGEKIDRLKYP